MLKASINAAKKINPDLKTNPVQSFDDYYAYIDRTVELIPQDILENSSDLSRDEILQSACYFYFLIDQPLTELKDNKLYNNALQYHPPFSTWTRQFAAAWGAFLDTERSWNAKTYQQFYNDPRYGLQKGWYESASNWSSFNQFFSRTLKSPDQRPIASPNNPAVVTSPADSVPQGVWAIDDQSKIRVEDGLKVKLTTLYSIKDLLGEDSQYRDAFANGVLTHTFLNVYDYHRYHFAIGGTVKEKRIIAQNVALEVSWNPAKGRYEPLDRVGWQFTQTRGYVIVETEQYGLVALIPMGMAQVSSVNFDPAVKIGTPHKKGDRLGYFLFGGSDFIMLFQQQAGFTITAAKASPANGESAATSHTAEPVYRHLLVGETYGLLKGEIK